MAPPRLTDAQWAHIAPIIAAHDPQTSGRRRIDARLALDTVIYRAVTGCAWNCLPAWCGDDSTVHRTYVRWRANGTLAAVYAALLGGAEKRGAA